LILFFYFNFISNFFILILHPRSKSEFSIGLQIVLTSSI